MKSEGHVLFAVESMPEYGRAVESLAGRYVGRRPGRGGRATSATRETLCCGSLRYKRRILDGAVPGEVVAQAGTWSARP